MTTDTRPCPMMADMPQCPIQAPGLSQACSPFVMAEGSAHRSRPALNTGTDLVAAAALAGPAQAGAQALPAASAPPTAPAVQAIPSDATPSYARNNGTWRVVEEAVVGLAHRAQNLPCQDAAQAVRGPRPVVVVADGAGSSAVSELGAHAVVTGTVRLLDSLDKPLAELLDSPNAPAPDLARTWGLLLVKHAMGLLKDLAAQHRREVRDFRCTFLLIVAGRERLLWLKVGDGALVVERMRLATAGRLDEAGPWQPELSTLGEAGKGEFANQTVFLDAATPDDVQLGWLPAGDITGMAAMSDGAAERLVGSEGSRVAPRMASLLEQLRAERLRRQALTQMFYEEGFCKGSSGDDRSIALAACGVLAPPAAQAHKASHAGSMPGPAPGPAASAFACQSKTPTPTPTPSGALPAQAKPPLAGVAGVAGVASAPGCLTLHIKKPGGKGKKPRR